MPNDKERIKDLREMADAMFAEFCDKCNVDSKSARPSDLVKVIVFTELVASIQRYTNVCDLEDVCIMMDIVSHSMKKLLMRKNAVDGNLVS